MNTPKSLARAREIAEKTIAGEFDPLLAARELVLLKKSLRGSNSSAWDDLEGVASEVDGLPLGDERKYWAHDALREKDQDAEDYRSQVRGVVCAALEKLLANM